MFLSLQVSTSPLRYVVITLVLHIAMYCGPCYLNQHTEPLSVCLQVLLLGYHTWRRHQRRQRNAMEAAQ